MNSNMKKLVALVQQLTAPQQLSSPIRRLQSPTAAHESPKAANNYALQLLNSNPDSDDSSGTQHSSSSAMSAEFTGTAVQSPEYKKLKLKKHKKKLLLKASIRRRLDEQRESTAIFADSSHPIEIQAFNNSLNRAIQDMDEITILTSHNPSHQLLNHDPESQYIASQNAQDEINNNATPSLGSGPAS